MSLRENFDPGVYIITHTKQLCAHKPVKYEYKDTKQYCEMMMTRIRHTLISLNRFFANMYRVGISKCCFKRPVISCQSDFLS